MAAETTAPDKGNTKKLLEEAKLKIDKLQKRVDSADPHALSQIHGAAISAAAFFDANAGCH